MIFNIHNRQVYCVQLELFSKYLMINQFYIVCKLLFQNCSVLLYTNLFGNVELDTAYPSPAEERAHILAATAWGNLPDFSEVVVGPADVTMRG